MRLLAAVAAATALSVFAGAHADSQPRRLPNFVIIFTDDQGYGDLGSCGTESDRFKRYMDPRIEYYNVPLMREGEIIERPAEQTTITQRYTDQGIAFMNANRERPFFLYLAHNMPHMPLFRSKEFENRSARGRYGDVIEEIDANVGRLVATLHDLRIERETLVLYISDNGPWAAFREQGGSAGPLRGAKHTTWEGGVAFQPSSGGPAQSCRA